MSGHEAELLDLAAALAEAARTRTPIEPISAGRPWLGAAEAYEIQRALLAPRRAAGERVVGWKVGLTSAAMQRQLGVDQPDYAPILSGAVVPAGGTIAVAGLCQPRIEAEIGFRLRRPLHGPGVTAEEVLDGTELVLPALEVIDSRIAGWRIGLADTIADLASSAHVVFAEGGTDPRSLDLRAVEVVLRRNGEVVGSGLGSAVLGDPAEAVAWAANTLGALGEVMAPGHWVIPGALHASVPAAAGDRFVAEFTGLGSVEVSFA